MSKSEKTWVRVKTLTHTRARTYTNTEKEETDFALIMCMRRRRDVCRLRCLMNNHYLFESSLIFQNLALFWAQHDECVCMYVCVCVFASDSRVCVCVCVCVCTSWEPSSINSASGFQRREEGKINSAQRRKRAPEREETQQKGSEMGQECSALSRKTHKRTFTLTHATYWIMTVRDGAEDFSFWTPDVPVIHFW